MLSSLLGFRAVEAAWQTEVTSILSSVGGAVHSWATSAGTNFANLLDVEMGAWIAGTEANVAAGISDEEADFDAEMDEDIAEFLADDAMLQQEADALPATVAAEAADVVADADAEANAARDAVFAEDADWLADEQAAVLDEAAHDNDEADAAVIDANADQDAADAWEHAEALDAWTDEEDVAQADEQSALAEAAADHTTNDAIADDRFDQEEEDAAAAETRDTDAANAHHTFVFNVSNDVVVAVHAAAGHAEQQVEQAVNFAAGEVGPDAALRLVDIQQRNAAGVIGLIADHDARLQALLDELPAAKGRSVAAAQQQYTNDFYTDASEFFRVNPAVPESAIQIVADYMPSVETIVTVSIGVALFIVPGGGVVLAVVGGGLLAWQADHAYGAALDRYFDGNQTITQAALGGIGDATGATQLWSGLTNRDIATGEHLGLTVAQQRSNITNGGVATIMSALPVVQGARSFVRGRTTAANRPVVENGPPTSGVHPEAPPRVPARSSGGSRAGEAGSAPRQRCRTPGCFVAGTPIRTPFGSTAIDRLHPGDLVLCKPDNEPSAPVVAQRIAENFVRVSHLLNLHVGGRIIQVSHEHPFWVENRGWVRAADLRIGDLLRTAQDQLIAVEGIAESGRLATVYNFRVDDYHTYYVGDESWGFDVWTHNTGEECAGAAPARSVHADISTGRSRAINLKEQLTLEEARAGAGEMIIEPGRIGDPRFSGGEWAKYQHVHRAPDGTNYTVHYMRNLITGEIVDVKLVGP